MSDVPPSGRRGEPLGRRPTTSLFLSQGSTVGGRSVPGRVTESRLSQRGRRTEVLGPRPGSRPVTVRAPPPRPQVGSPGRTLPRVYGLRSDHVLGRRIRLVGAPSDVVSVVVVGEDNAGHVEKDVGVRVGLPPSKESQDEEDVRVL